MSCDKNAKKCGDQDAVTKTQDKQQESDLKAALRDLVKSGAETEFLDLSQQAIASVEDDLMPYICQFKNLKEVNLEDNQLKNLPENMAQIFRNIQSLNLNGNEFDDFCVTVESLRTIPNLTQLFINLHEEEQVDFVMRSLPNLQQLNGLPVERDLIQSTANSADILENDPHRIEEENEDEEDTHNSSLVQTNQQITTNSNAHCNKSHSLVDTNQIHNQSKEEILIKQFDQQKKEDQLIFNSIEVDDLEPVQSNRKSTNSCDLDQISPSIQDIKHVSSQSQNQNIFQDLNQSQKQNSHEKKWSLATGCGQVIPIENQQQTLTTEGPESLHIIQPSENDFDSDEAKVQISQDLNDNCDQTKHTPRDILFKCHNQKSQQEQLEHNQEKAISCNQININQSNINTNSFHNCEQIVIQEFKDVFQTHKISVDQIVQIAKLADQVSIMIFMTKDKKNEINHDMLKSQLDLHQQFQSTINNFIQQIELDKDSLNDQEVQNIQKTINIKSILVDQLQQWLLQYIGVNDQALKSILEQINFNKEQLFQQNIQQLKMQLHHQDKEIQAQALQIQQYQNQRVNSKQFQENRITDLEDQIKQMEKQITQLNSQLEQNKTSFKTKKRKNPSIDLRQLQKSLEVDKSIRGTPLSGVCEQNTQYSLKGCSKYSKKTDISPVSQSSVNCKSRSKSIDKIRFAVDTTNIQKHKISRNLHTTKSSHDAFTKQRKSKMKTYVYDNESFNIVKNRQIESLSNHQRSGLTSLTKIVPNCQTNSHKNMLGMLSHRNLSLKNLREIIIDIQNQKLKFDRKQLENKQPRETMQQYVFTYFNQKYGLKNLVIEQYVALLNGIKMFHKDDHDIHLFGKILKNQCDEEFRFVQMHVKDTLLNLLRILLRDKYPFKGEADITKIIEQIQQTSPVNQISACTNTSATQVQITNLFQKDHGMYFYVIEEWMWSRIIQKMYDYLDAVELEHRFIKQIAIRDKFLIQYVECLNDNQLHQFCIQNAVTQNANKKVQRAQINQILRKHSGRLLYQDFQKIILDFQLEEHCDFLNRFVKIFKDIDQLQLGYINSEQFNRIMSTINLVSSQSEKAYLLSQVDPYSSNNITFSEMVQLLSTHSVEIVNDQTGQVKQVPILEKLNQNPENIAEKQP